MRQKIKVLIMGSSTARIIKRAARGHKFNLLKQARTRHALQRIIQLRRRQARALLNLRKFHDRRCINIAVALHRNAVKCEILGQNWPHI
ncbi:MAG: hypothetical protein U5N55_00590 [Cypionkella sp.]|nr:hypothetical protein [Cypionkella sp.]